MLHRRHRVDRLVRDPAQVGHPHRTRQIHHDAAHGTQRSDQLLGLGRRAEVRDRDRGKGLAPDLLGDLGHRRELVGVVPEGELVGSGRGHLTERTQHLRHLLDLPEQPTAVEVEARQQPDLHRSDDAEVATPAAQGPEQVRVGGTRHGPRLSVGVDDLHRLDGVRGEPVGPTEPAHPTGERHPHHRGVGAAPCEEGQARPLESGQQLTDLHAGADGDRALGDVDGDVVHGPRAQHDDAVHPVLGERAAGAVADWLGSHLVAVAHGPPHCATYVLGVGDLHDGQRLLGDVDGPRHPGGVPAGLASEVDHAPHAGP